MSRSRTRERKGRPRTAELEEVGAIKKDWGGRIPIALIYPNVYTVGMANLGYQFIYHLLNQEPDLVCERAFLPEAAENVPPQSMPAPRSLESAQPLSRFEVLAFSVPFENDYPHLLRILAAAGIPLQAARREPPQPMVWAGGFTASMNPEPLATFVDLFTIGEGEAILPELLAGYRQCRQERLSKKACLAALSRLEGIYVPAFYHIRYDRLGRVHSFRARAPAPDRVRRRIVSPLTGVVPASSLLTTASAFESMYLIEIGRGCPRGCRFCAAGHLFSPPRYRDMDDLLPTICTALDKTKRIGLVSSAVCDHPQIGEICRAILAKGGEVSVSSLRLDALDEHLLKSLVRSGHRTLALAPEAGSQRLRDVIRKGISEEQILKAVRRIAVAGIPILRLYFMVGLPGETWADIESIVALARKVQHQARTDTAGKGFQRLTLSVNPFVPKPGTPFQWHPFEEIGELKGRIQHIRRALRKKRAVEVIHEPPKWARIQALLSRGDRRIGRVLQLVADGRRWDEALVEVNLNPAFYLHRRRGFEEVLPWDFIDQGISKETLWRSYRSALRAAEI
jgi:radical SAM superfamily enzyme YgiQ (UPF0313 family)